jgi:hypothetical protein
MKKNCKLLILITCMMMANILANGQNPKSEKKATSVSDGSKCFDENTHIINVGVGFGGNYYSSYSGSGYDYRTTPAFGISYEQAFPKKLGPGYLGVGAYLGFQNSSSTYNYYYYKNGYNNNYYYKNSWNNTFIAARGVYHWDVLNAKNAEVYAGILIGFRIQTYNYETNNPDPNAYNYRLHSGSVYPTAAIFAGARWYFVKKVALFGEVGYGISYLNGGVSFKF